MQHGATLFVGRGHELAQLRARLDRAFGGAGTVTALVGEPGIGKTSTALAFAEEARARGAIVLRGACVEGDAAAPLRPWGEMLREVTRALGADRVTRLLGGSAPPLAAFVPELDAHAAAPLGAREERFRLYDAVAQLLLHASESSPLVLLFEDLHWADGDTVALFRHVARFSSRARWVVLATFRESEIDARGPVADLLARLRRETDYQRIALRGFALGEVAEMLAHRGAREIAAPVLRAIFDETVGNPLFVWEAYRHLVDEGKLATAGYAAELDVRALGIPAGVREAVGRRMARLSEDAAQVARIASATAGEAEIALLDAASGLDTVRLRACLAELARAGLMQIAASGDVEFVHPLFRRAIYDAQNPDRRARLHRRLAEALEADGARARAAAGRIAAHYRASLELRGSEQGVSHALAASADARAASAHERAVTLLRLARELAEGAPLHVRVEVLRELALAEATCALSEEACRTADAALHEMEAYASPREDVVAFLSAIARELKSSGAPPLSWEPFVERGLALAGKKRDLMWARLKLLEERIEPVASGAVHVNRVGAHDERAVRIARERGDEGDYADTIAHLARERAETDALARLAKSWSRPPAVARALDAVARDFVFRHTQLREARAPLRELLTVSERAGLIPAQAEALLLLAQCEAVLGDVPRARETRLRAQSLVARLGPAHPRTQIAALGLDTTFAYLFGGDWAAIAQPAARFAADPNAARLGLGHVAAGIAVLAYALAGYAKESRSLLGHLAPVFERCDCTVHEYGVALDCALVAVWHLGATDLAPRYLTLAELTPREAGMSPISVRELNVARMSVLANEPVDPADAFARARLACVRGALLPLRAIVDHDEASALLRSDDPALRPRACDLLEEARAVFQELAMDPWTAHANQLLGADRPPKSAPGSRAPKSRRPR